MSVRLQYLKFQKSTIDALKTPKSALNYSKCAFRPEIDHIYII